MRRSIIVVVVLVVALSAWKGDVNGYVLAGPSWAATQVQYYINPQNMYVSTSAGIVAIQSAASNWSTQSKANIQLVNAGTTTAAILALDYQNNVFFRDDSNGAFAAETYWWSSGNQLVDSDTVIHEAPYVYFTGTSGCTGNGLYVEDVMTHEFGHTLGMAHSTVTTATMYPSITYCSMTQRYLDPDDISGIQALYPPASSTPPAAPTQLSAVPAPSSPSSSTSLAWTDTATNATGYSVGRSADGVTFATVATLGSSAVSYVDSGLASGATYYYRVDAFNGAGTSGYSNVASVSTQSVTPPNSTAPAPTAITQPPSVPASPNPGNGATGVNTNATMSWATTAGAQNYDVYFGTSPTPGLYKSNLSSASFAVASLTPGATYYWSVTAKNSAGTAASNVWHFTVRTNKKK
jgi:hypothetical protein